MKVLKQVDYVAPKYYGQCETCGTIIEAVERELCYGFIPGRNDNTLQLYYSNCPTCGGQFPMSRGTSAEGRAILFKAVVEECPACKTGYAKMYKHGTPEATYFMEAAE